VKREIDIEEISKFRVKYKEKNSLSLGREGKGEGKIILFPAARGDGEINFSPGERVRPACAWHEPRPGVRGK